MTKEELMKLAEKIREKKNTKQEELEFLKELNRVVEKMVAELDKIQIKK